MAEQPSLATLHQLAERRQEGAAAKEKRRLPPAGVVSLRRASRLSFERALARPACVLAHLLFVELGPPPLNAKFVSQPAIPHCKV